MVGHKSMLFVINNYDDERVNAVKTCIAKRLSAGFEIGKVCGTPHIQGAVVWPYAITFEQAQKRLGGPCATMVMKGTWAQNCKYTQKDGNILRVTDDSHQGARSDIAGARDAIKRKASDVEMLEEHCEIVAKYPKFIQHCRQVYDKIESKEFRKVEVIVRFGDPGMGKSRIAFEEGAYCVASYEPEWWDGYEGEKVVLFDDFYGQIRLSRMLRLLDGYTVQVPVKGGFRYLLATKIYITSNVHPDEWYPNVKEQYKVGLPRRITAIHNLYEQDFENKMIEHFKEEYAAP